MNRLVISILLLALTTPSLALGAAFTSVQTGNWSDNNTWGTPVAVPGDGDTATIASGHVVTVTSNVTVGATTGTAHGVLINGTSAASFGKLVVNAGVTLTLKGVSRTYYAMKVSRYGQFEPAPGARIEVNCTSDGQTGILNEGIINAIGTVANPITFSVPTANRSWTAVQTTAARPPVADRWPYDADLSIACVELQHTRISSADNTGIGTWDNSSLVISAQSPATICQTPVSSIAACNSAGKYYVDHAAGLVYFYHTYPDGNPTFNVAFSYMDDATANWRGWFIDAGNTNSDVTYNEMKFSNCIFEYMGSMGGTRLATLRIGFKGSGLGANREAYVKNSTFRWNGQTISLNRTNVGTANDPVLIDNNIFTGCEYSGTDTGGISVNLSLQTVVAHSYLTISNNTVDSRYFLDSTIFSAANVKSTVSNVRIVNNTTTGQISFFRDFTPPGTSFPDGEISGNIMDGIGKADINCRGFLDIRGTTGHPVVINNNAIKHFQQSIIVNNDATITRNIITHPYLAAFVGGSGFNGWAPNVLIQNNAIFGLGPRNASAPVYDTYGLNGMVSLYIPAVGRTAWFDNWVVTNNTFANARGGALGLGDISATGAKASFGTGIVFANNLIYGGTWAMQRKTDSTTEIWRGAVDDFWGNLAYNQATATYTNLNSKANSRFLRGAANFNTDATRNVKGVSLWNPSYTADQTGRTVALTVNSADNNVTLAWGSGDPVQLIWQTKKALTSAVAAVVGTYGLWQMLRATDNTQTWNTNANNAACPQGRWIKFLDGAAVNKVGVVLANAATTVDFAATWLNDTLPSANDNYVIYNGQVMLYDGAGSTGDNVLAGIDLRTLPTSTQSDTGITIDVDGLVTGDPILTDNVGLTAASYKVGASSPALNAGTATNAPATDYWGTSRPQGAAVDIGFYEALVSSGWKGPPIIFLLR